MFQEPEICRTPLEDVLLQMRTLGIKDVESFPFPTRPPIEKLRQALRLLIHIGAISNDGLKIAPGINSLHKKDAFRVLNNSGGDITPTGKLISRFPLNPRLSKMLVVAHKSNMLAHGLNLVVALAEKSPFLNQQELLIEDGKDEVEESAQVPLAKHADSDALARMRAFGAFSHIVVSQASYEQKIAFCNQQRLLSNILERMLDLRAQLLSLCSSSLESPQKDLMSYALEPPSPEEEVALRQIILTGFCDCIARKAPPLSEGSRRMKLTAYFSCNADVTVPIYIHPSSTLFKQVRSQIMSSRLNYPLRIPLLLYPSSLYTLSSSEMRLIHVPT